MTVIAWDGETLAADRRMSRGWTTIARVVKISRNGNTLVGWSGCIATAIARVEWLRAGGDNASHPVATADEDRARVLVINDQKEILIYETSPHPMHILGPHAAIGGGESEAMVAMHCGKSAREAVEITALFNAGVGDGVDTLTFETADNNPPTSNGSPHV